jgi:hypothetical protein
MGWLRLGNISKASVADTVAGAGLDGLVSLSAMTHKTLESIGLCNLIQTRLNPLAEIMSPLL